MDTRFQKAAGAAFLLALLLCLLGSRLYTWPVSQQPNDETSSARSQPSLKLKTELQNRITALLFNITSDPVHYVGVGELRRVTNAQQGFHMSGYFDKSPWSSDGTKLLYQRIPHYDNSISDKDVMQIGVLHLNHPGGAKFELLTNTSAWNHQQGTMLQWLGWSSSVIAFNIRTTSNTFAGVLYDIHQRRVVGSLPKPIYSLNFNGTVAVSLSFARLWVARRDYGYAVDETVQAQQRAKLCPEDDGIWVMEGIQDPDNVKARLVVNIRTVFEAAAIQPVVDPFTKQPFGASFAGLDVNLIRSECLHWINHAQINREGTKVLFLYRVGHCRFFPGWKTFVYTVDIATGELWRVPLAHGSHHDFGWDDNLVSCDGSGYYYAKVKTFAVPLARPADVANGGDGHCSFSPTSTEFILSDTYPHQVPGFPAPIRKLFTWDVVLNRTTIVGQFAPMKEGKGLDSRVDLHPRWSRDGRYVCFDSTHEGLGRQVYIAKVYEKALIRPGVDVLSRPPRKFYMDLGARTGDTVEKFLKTKVDGADYYFHAFECNPENIPLVKAGLARLSTAYKLRPEQVVLIEAAAWIKKDSLSFNMDTRPVGADGEPGKTGGSLFTSPHALGTKVTVPAVDFSDYLESTVKYTDHVACKIDIEGAEYELFTHLMRRGTIILCDVVYIEWHSRFRNDWTGWDGDIEAMLSKLHIPVIRIA